MKCLIRMFFRGLRIVIGPFLLLREKLCAPTGVIRAPEVQNEVIRDCEALALYQYKTCPFCIKVRQEMRRLSLPIELRDAQFNEQYKAELLQEGGRLMVPCLRIVGADGEVQWLYESDKINEYLHERFGVQ